MNYQDYILPHIWSLKPYSSARDEFKGEEGIFLDANENPIGSGNLVNAWNRYPDPLQRRIKTQLAEIKSCNEDQLFLGNGSDEAIDLLMRMTCASGLHNIIICPPTYGMYEVSASINNISINRVNLNADYQLNVSGILNEINDSTRLIFICSPNNPTGNKINRSSIYQILDSFKTGFVIIDEAYIDFSDEPSFIQELATYPQLIILQTLSKAYGLASLRLGMAFANPQLIALLNKIKPPYNIGGATQEIVLKALSNKEFVKDALNLINEEKRNLVNEFEKIPQVKKIYTSHSNFLLVNFEQAQKLFDYLIDEKVITRNRSNVPLCEESIRITIGLPTENRALLQKIKSFYL
ncbi:histidinol-phosphate transaminase [Aquirufa sp.]|jgi:histidinol-phosphate aminotransferase|uniref:histidinol-phosphate transaminase n=1 Tax=Aquirufa sp. TaxID=2676249 RepID=UPI0037C19701